MEFDFSWQPDAARMPRHWIIRGTLLRTSVVKMKAGNP
jgi:hypothetical protein